MDRAKGQIIYLQNDRNVHYSLFWFMMSSLLFFLNMGPHQILSCSMLLLLEQSHPGLISRPLSLTSVAPVLTSFQASSSKFPTVGCFHIDAHPAPQTQQVKNSLLSHPTQQLICPLITSLYSLSLGHQNFSHLCSYLCPSIHSVPNTWDFFFL